MIKILLSLSSLSSSLSRDNVSENVDGKRSFSFLTLGSLLFSRYNRIKIITHTLVIVCDKLDKLVILAWLLAFELIKSFYIVISLINLWYIRLIVFLFYLV